MNQKRSIMIISGTRADYGLLKNIIREVHGRSDLELKLVVTGTHLSPEHNTIKEIEADGFPIALKLHILSEMTDQDSASQATAKLISGLSSHVKTHRPDIMVILGDRYEMLGAATVGILHNIPMAHIHGGELTLGAIDDAIRHSMTKMSWWHFTTTEEYRKRVIHLGEHPDRVFNTGAPAIDALDSSNMSKEELEASLGMKLVTPIILATFHPETQSPGKALEQIKIVCQGIAEAGAGTVVFTKANADAEGNIINNYIEEMVNRNVFPNSLLVTSLGQKRYLSLLRLADVAVGNSSSLVIEAPMVKTPSVNIGIRQEGRTRCESIKDVPFVVTEISKAIREVFSPSFREKVQTLEHPFGKPGVAKRIVDILSKTEIPKSLVKGFYE